MLKAVNVTEPELMWTLSPNMLTALIKVEAHKSYVNIIIPTLQHMNMGLLFSFPYPEPILEPMIFLIYLLINRYFTLDLSLKGNTE